MENHQPISRLPMFWSGIKAELPLLIGVFPFGMIYGVLALEAGIPAGTAQAMSAIVFAGSSQFITTQLVGNGTPALIMILTIFIVNLRHALYSASIAPYISKLSGGWKALLAYLLTDEAYAVVIIHYDQEGAKPASHWFYLGAGLALWTTWQVSTEAGILLGAVIPASWSLDFTLALTFIALIMPLLKDRPSVGAALAAGLIAMLGVSLPFRLGLVGAALGGILVGLLLEKWK
jgi:4-azaleucine resistance transporter AzlC